MTTPVLPTAPLPTAVVLAGERPGGDALAADFAVPLKALVPIAGRTMLARVVAALQATPGIGNIVVLGQDPRCMAGLESTRAVFHAGGDGISASIAAVAGSAAAPWPVLVTTADHPLLTPQIISGFLDQADGCDLAVGMVERRTLLAQYPENRRTWLKFADGQWSGANLFLLNGPKIDAALALWSEVEQDRKKVIKLFWHFGPVLALRAMTRTIRLRDALARVGQRLGLSVRLVALPFAEAAIDVDKRSDHTLAEAILARREQAPEAS